MRRMHAACTIFSTAVVMHNDCTVIRSAFGPPRDDIAVSDIAVNDTAVDDIPVRDRMTPRFKAR
jgi:hypothetical protein